MAAVSPLAGCAAGAIGAGSGGTGANYTPAAAKADMTLAGSPAERTAGAKGEMTTGATASAPAKGGYALSDDELGLDCKRLTGKLQILILELRTDGTAQQTSSLSRTLQAVSVSAFGGPSPTLDAKSQRQQDLAKAESYNRQLAAKDCRSYDLAKALSGTETTPAATRPPPSQAQPSQGPGGGARKR
ncbi:MAG: hypothetical protein ABL907_09010 [Hyphomicrobium sp.]